MSIVSFYYFYLSSIKGQQRKVLSIITIAIFLIFIATSGSARTSSDPLAILEIGKLERTGDIFSR